MPNLPDRPSLEYLRKHAKRRRRERGIGLALAQREIAAEFGSAGWPRLVRHVQATDLRGVERALALADPDALHVIPDAEPGAATQPVGGTGR